MANDNVKMPRIDSWCRTRAGEEVKFTFAWTIERFSERPEKKFHPLHSNVFTIHGPNNQKNDWRIELFPKGSWEVDLDSDFLSVYLRYEGNDEAKAKFGFSILDAYKTKQNYKSFDSFKLFEESDGYNNSPYASYEGFHKFISLDSLKTESAQFLPNDSLTILCEVTVFFPTESISVTKDADMKQLSQDNLKEDLGLAFSKKKYTDVKIYCGDEVFECHRFMLTARSPVFRAMFEAEMMEKKTQRVDIQDLPPEIFSEMLSFIYTGKSPNVDNLAEALIEAADKYQVEMLKTICAEKLCNNIEVNNCIKYLLMGDMYQADVLKEFALDFIAKNVASVCKTGDWSKGLQNHLMAKVIEAIGRKETSGNVARDPEAAK